MVQYKMKLLRNKIIFLFSIIMSFGLSNETNKIPNLEIKLLDGSKIKIHELLDD